jgi:DNA-binding NarL/FixJ family response regulator
MSPSEGRNHQDADFVPRKLTNRQMAVVRELADGCDIAMVAARRNRGLSSVYEIVGRICERWGLKDWREIGPYARAHGFAEGQERSPAA